MSHERNPEAGRRAARYFGAEAEANPGTFFQYDYADTIAFYWGYGEEYEDGLWKKMTAEEQAEARQLFKEGRRAERKANLP